MVFRITDITSTLNKYSGTLKPSSFYARMTPPRQILSVGYDKDSMYLCDAAQLPGLNYATQGVKMMTYDNVEQRPTTVNFPQLNLTFIVDGKAKVFEFFQKWSALINNWSIDTQGTSSVSNLRYGEWSYPEEYEGVVEVYHHDVAQKQVIKFEMNRAFPVQIGDVNVAWENNDSVMRIPVVFAYKSWKTENVTGSSEDGTSSRFNAVRPDLGSRYSYGNNAENRR